MTKIYAIQVSLDKGKTWFNLTPSMQVECYVDLYVYSDRKNAKESLEWIIEDFNKCYKTTYKKKLPKKYFRIKEFAENEKENY